MAEDQNVNGDRWNDQAFQLLKRFGWEAVGDANMDLPGADGDALGIDRMYFYTDFKRSELDQAVVMEAKRYKTTSFSLNGIEGWIKTLDSKLNEFKNSGGIYEKFPNLSSRPIRTGVIMIWFHDLSNYIDFAPRFRDALANVKLSRRPQASNNIYVFDNENILRLASLQDSVSKLNQNLKDSLVKFYYPSHGSHLAHRSTTLNLNYMASKFILAEYLDDKQGERRVVFYFGSLSLNSFLRLKHALALYGYLDKDKPLTIYTYQRDDSEFRKIFPSVVSIFDGQQVEFSEMEVMGDLPTFMRK